MIATCDRRRRPFVVNIQMTLDEFRETVEWLEMIDWGDGATKEWRKELDSIDPPEMEE